MVKLTQVNKIQIYIFSSFESIKKNLKSWNDDLYMSSFKVQISSSIILRESFFGDQFTTARGRPVWPVMPGSYPFYPLMGKTVKILLTHPSTDAPSSSSLPLAHKASPLAISSFIQGKGDPFVEFASHHWPDRPPKPVLRFLLWNPVQKKHQQDAKAICEENKAPLWSL